MPDRKRPPAEKKTTRSSAEDVPFARPAPVSRRLRAAAQEERSERDTIRGLIRDFPNFLKLFGRLARDSRISRVDKAMVLVTIAYIVMPFDFVPDFLPFLGQIDDVYLLALALDRLLHNAGMDVLLEHWDGRTENLHAGLGALETAGSFLPDSVRGMVRSVLSDH